MSQTEPWTIGRLLQWTADYLKQHGSDSPRLDAEVLLAHARGCRRIELYTSFADEAPEELRSRFRDLVRRRAEGTPVAYLVGHREFYSLEFRVTPDVLIPRPETESLVVQLVDMLRGQPEGQATTVADVGTGSGIIAICAALQSPNCHVVAIDISPAALAIARENAARHGIIDRIELVEGDLFSALAAERKFNFIASNPPYVSTSELEALSSDVRNYEPQLALAGGPQGTTVIERLIAESAERLVAGGTLLMEISPMIHERVLSLIATDGHFDAPSTIKDLAQLPRVVIARKK